MRTMTNQMLAALSAPALRLAIFVQISFAASTEYLWSGVGSIVWNGHTWLGIGSTGKISVIEDSATIEAKGIVLTLSGIDPVLVADALQEIQLGAPVIVYLGLFDTSSPPALIADPITAWSGRVDQPTFDVGGEAASIALNCENRLLDMNISVERRYTHEDQQIDYPGDFGFQFVLGIQEITIYWGRLPSNPNNL